MYADNITLVAESAEDLQRALKITDDTFLQWGMEISVRKTQIIRLSSTASEALLESDPVKGYLRGNAIVEVDKFEYSGSMSSANMSIQPRIANRLSRAGGVYHEIKEMEIWGDGDISQGIKSV